MDFLDPKKKRAHNIRLFVGYGLMSVLIMLATGVLVLQTYGYRFNLRTGDVTQSGLVFADARPEPARVILNGEDKGQTDKRLDIPAGNYRLELTRSGYRSWARSFSLEGGTLVRLLYPVLFPVKLVTSEVINYTKPPQLTSQSSDRRWLVVQRPGSVTKFDVFDLTTELPVASSLTLPASLLTSRGKTHQLASVEWSNDNRHILMKHTYSGGSEFLLVDREQPTQSVNLSKIFTQTFTSISLRDKRFDRYYLHDQKTGNLSSAELETRSVSVLVENVLPGFQSFGDDVLIYASPSPANKNKVVVSARDDDQTYPIKEFTSGSTYLLDVARYNGVWYMVAGSSEEEKVYIYRDPVGALRRSPSTPLSPVSILRQEGIEYISFSSFKRFLAVQAGSRFVVHDIEANTTYSYDTKLKLAKTQRATWMDGYHMSLVSGDKVQVFDYDGINIQTLSSSYAGFIPYFDRNYTGMYTFTASATKGRSALLRTELLVKPE